MKTLFLSIALFYFSTIFSQEIEPGKNYFFNSSLNRNEMQNKTDLIDGEEELPPVIQGYEVHVLEVTSDEVFFKYLKFKDEDLKEKYNGEEDEEKIFSMSKDYFESKTEILYDRFRGFKYGAYSVPIRIRNSNANFEFDSNLSLGANIISRWGLRKYEHFYVDFSLGISLTKVNLNEDNSNLGMEGTKFEDIKTLSPAALTVSIGTLFNLAENVNTGIYYGWDFISSSDQKAEWIYNKKPWLGIGINVAFNGSPEKSGSQKGTQ